MLEVRKEGGKIMSEQLFPTLMGMDSAITKTPVHNTSRKVAQNGGEVRAKLQAYPRYKFKLTFNYLKDLDNSYQDDDLRLLMGFYNRMGGSFDNFLLHDKSDDTATDQLFAVGDGVTTTYQLVKKYGGFVEPIFGANLPTISVLVDRIPVPYSISNSCVVQFLSPPPVGAKLTWSGMYYFRVLFDEDSNDFESMFSGIWTLNSLKLISERVL